MSRLCWIDPRSPPDSFPEAGCALADPDGLVAAGGDLSSARLLCAYRRGIFPWYESDQPILWWSPDPRSVLLPGQVKISRSLRKTRRRGHYTCTFDRAFRDVVDACAAPRADSEGTWITTEMRNAYVHLHELGYAHSVECWQNGALAGGLYGVAVGRVFFGESMFSRSTDASKVALCDLSDWLADWHYALIDCQMTTAHLSSLGASELPRARFIERLSELCNTEPSPQAWVECRPAP